ncbi:hypothetical protein HZ326_25705 [Fusarium oxysporum f. sp. albedinis]|nr:hypothetical protein HZ326_25705 [Fusarium oxysporum f. sp. albedinis]
MTDCEAFSRFFGHKAFARLLLVLTKSDRITQSGDCITLTLECSLASRLPSSVLALGCPESGWNFTSVQIDQIKIFPLLADLGLGCGRRKTEPSPRSRFFVARDRALGNIGEGRHKVAVNQFDTSVEARSRILDDQSTKLRTTSPMDDGER